MTAEARPQPWEEASRCVKCGTCSSVCPVFALRRRESHSPRGKLALVEDVGRGQLRASPAYADILGTCLLCGACQEACPSGVKTMDAFLGAREGNPLTERTGWNKGVLLGRLLRTVGALRLAVHTGAILQRLLFKRVPSASGLRRRFPLPGIPSGRLIPDVAPVFFEETFAGVVREGDGPRVAIFTGCLVNYLYPRLGGEVVRLLGAIGATVVVPSGQGCCGVPALTGGSRDAARELALRNLGAFEEAVPEVIITPCASCGSFLKTRFPSLLEEAGVSQERIAAFSRKVMDLSEFLNQPRIRPLLRPERASPGEVLTVTWHQPCHLGRLQGVRNDPLALLKGLPGVILLPMEEADRCCGMGGSFSVQHYQLSQEINDRKVRNIRATGARAVVTACPACILHLRDGLRRNGLSSVRVLHLAEVLAWSLLERAGSGEEGEEGRAAGGGSPR